jgi:hypothetical protein
MATVNLGSIKFKWKGTYSGATAYTIDDVVEYNGSSYICILASTGNLPTNATYFEQMSQKGTDGTDLTTTLTTQGDILYRDGSGLVRLGAGTSGQALITGGTGANPSWGTISSGTYSVHAFDRYSYATNVTVSSQLDYHDIAGGNTVSFTPTSTDDYIFFTHYNDVYQPVSSSGSDVYLMMKAGSSSIGSGDIKLNYSGQHTNYISSSGWHLHMNKSFLLPCTTLTPATTYYVEQAGATHSVNNTTFNHSNQNQDHTYGGSKHYVSLTHFKRN